MAGIGVKLNKIYSKRTIATGIWGVGYSTVVSIAPMIVVILAVILMQKWLGYSDAGYASRELFSCTVLYIFIFSLLTASPFNAVLSKYLSDIIYYDEYDSIMPCYYVGLSMNAILSFLVGVPFCLHEYFVGEVDPVFVFISFFGYMSLMIVFYTMLYLSICKVYKRISLFFIIGMTITVILSLVLVYLFGMDVIYAMVISLDVGFMIIASLEYALIRSYFRENSGKYKEVFDYLKKYSRLIITNFLYILGLYIHNFVFWTTDMRIVVVKSFVCMPAYDMATCLAMFTNISASVIFISRVEMYFHERYKNYSEAVTGGRGMDIRNAKLRMFEQLADELLNLVRIQFIVTVVVFFLAMIFLPRFGFGGLVLRIYPCLTAGYFILFIMYAAIIFLYYFNDFNGAVLTALVFVLTTLVGSIISKELPPVWFGLGLVLGTLAGWTTSYLRLRKIERTLDVHIFCTGTLMKHRDGEMPSNQVYPRTEMKEK
ncbi:MAG: exopolysaccharide Pel transporter PelG [Lachnospiraceae bacterium]|nr:exopolysaccharide Pel transporter PelG [Lachnospiraceae bacterium]